MINMTLLYRKDILRKTKCMLYLKLNLEKI